MKHISQSLVMVSGPPNLFADCLARLLEAEGYQISRGTVNRNEDHGEGPSHTPILIIWGGSHEPSTGELCKLRGENLSAPLLVFSPTRGATTRFHAPEEMKMLWVNMNIAVEDFISSIYAMTLRRREIRQANAQWKRPPSNRKRDIGSKANRQTAGT